MTSAATDTISWPRAFMGAVFLASSWTWCIGLFLPVYLVRDFGWPGWVAFAVPNVIGATLVGFVWRRAGESERFVERNLGAMRAFSAWTVLFHFAFLGWILTFVSQHFLQDWAPGGAALGVVLILAMSLGGLGGPALRGLALVAYLGVWLMLFFASRTGSTITLPPASGLLRTVDLALLLPVICFGFLLCPHLDLTIHRVRQELPGRTGTAAFVLGFGVLFLGMIVVSLLYATRMSEGSYSLYTIAILGLQCVFTCAVHLRELFERGVVFSRAAEPFSLEAQRRRTAASAAIATTCLVVVVLIVAAIAEGWVGRYLSGKMSPREMIYKCFLGAYALVFPAWAWIVAWRPTPSRRVRFAVFCIAMLPAAPCLWMGLLQGPIIGEPARWYLLLPLGVLAPTLAAVALIRSARRPQQAA